jgi:hypothetical protein
MVLLLGGETMVKRDKLGRVVCRVDGVKSDKVFSLRLTQKEYDLIQRAKKGGHDPREILLDQLRSRLETKSRET